MKVAFTRAGVEHVFRIAKTEIGFYHFEGRSYPMFDIGTHKS
jgi:hypothetical protein